MSILAAFGVGHVHDVWIVQAGYITPEMQREAERLGAKISTYNFALRTTNAEAGRYYAGLYTWSLGLAGNTSYNYVWLPSYGPGLRKQAFFDEPWKLSKPANLGHVIPSPVGPVPSVMNAVCAPPALTLHPATATVGAGRAGGWGWGGVTDRRTRRAASDSLFTRTSLYS